MQLLDRYFFSFRQDVLAFTSFIPIYLLSLLLFEVLGVKLPSDPPNEFFILGFLLVDGSHVYSTLLVSYFDPGIYRQLKRVFIAVPLILIVLAFITNYSGNRSYFMHFLGYLALIHFIRQEFGWMKLASRFDPASPKWLRFIDVHASYAMTILPMLWVLRSSNLGFWYVPGDLLAVPDVIGEIALKLYFPTIFIFLGGNLWHIYRTKIINVSKFLVALNTFFGWYMAKVYVQNPYLALWFLIFHHGLPYYFLVLRTERVTLSRWPARLAPLRIPIVYLACVALFGASYYLHSVSPFIKEFKSVPLYKWSIYALAIFPQMTHFILDGYIWKKKYGLVS